MELWTQTALILALSAAITGASEDGAIDDAIRKCNDKLGTNFDFKLADAPPRQIQSGGFFDVASHHRRPNPRLARLFPQHRRPFRHQFALMTTWKKPLTVTTTARPGGGDAGDTITRSCSVYLTNQEPAKYVLTCNNVTREGEVEKTDEVPLISSTASSVTEQSETGQEEEITEDGTWDLSRCLGCIMELLSAQG